MVNTWLTASHLIIFGLLLGFAIVHSGLAALRPWGEKQLGARLYRVVFALASLPYAAVLIIYFINHRYDGLQLWNLQGVAGIEPLVWSLSAISFAYGASFKPISGTEIVKVRKASVRSF